MVIFKCYWLGGSAGAAGCCRLVQADHDLEGDTAEICHLFMLSLEK